ncbi:MAG: WYL domain-containing protein [Marinilabiliaceae bacterium]|nr:WYL domain-containing protein [Marinilabiliaceae bacterium]
MSKREAILRYNLIINKVRKRTCTFEEINEYLEDKSIELDYNLQVSKRTFKRDLEDIASLYDIVIKYNFSTKVYSIRYDGDQDVHERLLEAFDTFHALKVADELTHHIDFEKRRPQGTEHLYGLLHAVKNRLQVKFSYNKYFEGTITQRQVEPYALKEFKNRWYVLAKDIRDERIKSFGLDRVSELDITKVKFEHPTDFNVNTYYRHCFGIISSDDDEPEEVELWFDHGQGKYIKSLPLHHSQETMVDNEEELRIQLKIHVTHDFKMELLSYGHRVKVIRPQWLANELKETYRKAWEAYQ